MRCGIIVIGGEHFQRPTAIRQDRKTGAKSYRRDRSVKLRANECYQKAVCTVRIGNRLGVYLCEECLQKVVALQITDPDVVNLDYDGIVVKARMRIYAL